MAPSHWTLSRALASVVRIMQHNGESSTIDTVTKRWPQIRPHLAPADIELLACIGFHRRLGDQWSREGAGRFIIGADLNITLSPSVVHEQGPITVTFTDVYYANAVGAQVPLRQFSRRDLEACLTRLTGERDGLDGKIMFLDAIYQAVLRCDVLRVGDLPGEVLQQLEQQMAA